MIDPAVFPIPRFRTGDIVVNTGSNNVIQLYRIIAPPETIHIQHGFQYSSLFLGEISVKNKYIYYTKENDARGISYPTFENNLISLEEFKETILIPKTIDIQNNLVKLSNSLLKLGSFKTDRCSLLYGSLVAVKRVANMKEYRLHDGIVTVFEVYCLSCDISKKNPHSWVRHSHVGDIWRNSNGELVFSEKEQKITKLWNPGLRIFAIQDFLDTEMNNIQEFLQQVANLEQDILNLTKKR